MVNIGIVGMGFMGVTHFKAVDRVRGGRVRAIATRDAAKRRGDWRRVKGNFGGSGGTRDLSRVRCYATLAELLDDEGIDLVDVCLPTHLHTDATLAALRAGKHVLLEKPIAVDLRHADRLIAAAERCRRLLMVAHVLRFFPEFVLVKECVDSGDHGRVLAARFRRIIARPAWSSPEDLRSTGGPAIDLHIHDADFVRYVFGDPRSVSSAGCVERGGIVEHIDTHYEFGERGPMVTAEGGWLSQQACSFEHGYDVYFESATLKFNSSWGRPPLLLGGDGRSRQPRLRNRSGFVGEMQEAVDAVAAGRPSDVLGAASARSSLDLCLKEVRSALSGRRVRL